KVPVPLDFANKYTGEKHLPILSSNWWRIKEKNVVSKENGPDSNRGTSGTELTPVLRSLDLNHPPTAVGGITDAERSCPNEGELKRKCIRRKIRLSNRVCVKASHAKRPCSLSAPA